MPSILHIGCDKTGTTAIQHALSSNRPALLEAGFLYPKVDDRPDHRALLAEPSLLRTGRTELTVVLSFEGFWPAGPDHLAELIDRLPAPISVIGWARSPQNYVDAAFRHQCRNARSPRQLSALLKVARLPPAINPVARRCVQRYGQILPWKQSFGDNLIIRDYEQDARSIVDAFTSTTGLPELESGDARKNVSPSIDALYALARERQENAGVDPHLFLQTAAETGDAPGSFLIPENVRRWCWEHTADARHSVGLNQPWESQFRTFRS